MSKFLLIVALVILLLPSSANAARFLSDENVSPADTVNEDLYIAASRIDIRHDVEGDVFLGGQIINITKEAKIKGDIYAGGNNITIDGELTDDLIVGGENIFINSPRIDDLFAAGKNITISKNTLIAGDIYAGGARVTIAGTIKGTVRARVENLVIESGTIINGDLLTWGNNKPVIESDVVVTGTTRHHFQTVMGKDERARNSLLLWVKSVVTWFIAALILLYLLPSFTQKIIASANTKAPVSFGIGVLVIIFFLPLSLLLFISQVGIPLGLIVLFGFIPLFVTALIYANLLVGQFVHKKITKTTTDKINWQHALLGVFVFKILIFIPVIGWLLALVLIILTLGALTTTCWQLKRS